MAKGSTPGSSACALIVNGISISDLLLLSSFAHCLSQLIMNFDNRNGDLNDVIVSEFDSGSVVIKLAHSSN